MDVSSVETVDALPVTMETMDAMPAGKGDHEGDLRILEALQSRGEKTVAYSFDFRPWDIRVIRAHEGGSIRQEGIPSDVSYALVFKETPPDTLKTHLEQLARQEVGESAKGFIGALEVKPAPILPPPVAVAAKPSLSSIDEQILECFHSDGFVSQAFPYIYDGERYDVRIINNPDNLPLWAEGASEVVYFPYAIIISGLGPPKDLVTHLKKLADERWKKITGYVPTSGFLFEDHFHRSAGLGPILINRNGNMDTTFDPLIRDCFSSSQFINRVFHYEIDGKEYHVRIVNNPQKNNIRVTQWFPDPYGVKECTIDWPYRYGIMIDEQAPPELVKHIENLAKPRVSWWDWYRSFDVKNGPQAVSLQGGKKVTIGYRAFFEYARPH